jgi:hypothetical protein
MRTFIIVGAALAVIGAAEAHASCEKLLGSGYRCDTPRGDSVTITQTLDGAHQYKYSGGGVAIERFDLDGGYSYSTTGRVGDLPMQGGRPFRPYD